MASYEHLLSKDPIGALDKIKEDYLRYFKTMYRFEGTGAKYSKLDQKKNDQLENGENLAKEPYCELMPKYQLLADDLKTLCSPGGEYSNVPGTKQLPDGFADFINLGLMNYKPYKHQFEMLCKGYGQGNDVLITSGTGSGKTESFLLPLFASLLDEASKWNANNYNASWWKQTDNIGKYIPNQRDGENRPDAIRAILLYPMNALVADQVKRLRKALDSDDVRNFLDNKCKGNRIFFGSYNGRTLKSKDDKTADSLKTMKDQADLLCTTFKSGGCEPDDIYVSPRLSDNSFTSEMLVREDMQNKCPDILITNISMLNIMLMRAEEQGMLVRTKEYYKQNPDAVFHLIVDELHLHRGTAGAEVAYLLRMFLERIGVPPMKDGKKNPQLRIYASSASLGPDAQAYLEEFFGVYNTAHAFIVQNGYDISPRIKPGLVPLDYGKFDIFFRNNSAKKEYYDQDAKEKTRTEQEFLNAIKYSGSFSDFLDDYSGQIYLDLKGLTTNEISTFPLSKLRVLNGLPSEDAIRGFFIFRGQVKNENLPSIRFHQFYRYIDGIWGELLPDNVPDAPIGEILFHPEEVSSNGQHKVLELLRCECCGELFIGGNRTDLDNGNRVALSLNSPELEKIPNMQATPMVQRKNINEYALFWPGKKTDLNGWYSTDPQSGTYERFGVVNSLGKDSREDGNNDCHGAWKKGYLNPFDGSVVFDSNLGPNQKAQFEGNCISGYLYTPRDIAGNAVTNFDNKVLKALPCKCPACEKDYRKRLYTKSPIRSFRTGMGRNNQIFSKELLYQLDSDGNHKPKLIGFSDSRQDAAEQSKLISREHYRDMLRSAFIKIITQKSSGIISPALSTLKATIIALLNGHLPLPNIISITRGDTTVSTSEITDIIRILKSGKPVINIVSDINSYVPRIDCIDLDKLISKNPNMIDGEIVSELLKLGINPAGSEYSDMYPTDSGVYWDKLYDFNQGIMNASSWGLSCGNGRVLGNVVYKNIESNIFSNCFGQYMNVNTEAAGLGYVASKDVTGIDEVEKLKKLLESASFLTSNGLTVEGVLNAFIRIYGDNYRYDGDFEADPMPNYGDFSKQMKKAVKALAKEASVGENSLGDAICNAMCKVATNQDGKLTLDKPLRFALSHSSDSYYRCSKCGRVHLHRGMGICTNTSCLSSLPSTPIAGSVKDLWKSNYISFDIKEEPHEPKRLHSEELTGQTDDQTSRLLDFKDIILEGQPIARAIDMLSVTTTMEVGVDIGSLQAIYQGNMPPTRYNYQQRVGRAGRRGQAFSAALTFCRGRSHDNYYYYQATDQMTGGKPANPTISVNPIVGGEANPVILKRIILKHILMEISSRRIDWAVGGGTSGQLGGKGKDQVEWSKVRPEIASWIQTNENEIKDIIKYYTRQFIPEYDSLNGALLQWIKNDVLKEMDDAIDKSTQSDNALAITEAGLLPMYGMPSTVRYFYHNGSRSVNKYQIIESFNGVIDRPIEQAITEFAPGAIKTKDAAEYRSAGLTVPLENVPVKKKLTELGTEDLDPLEHSFNLNMNGMEISSIVSYEPSRITPTSRDVIRLVIPKAFRTDKLFNNKGEFRQEDDSRSNYSPVNTWVKVNSTAVQTFNGGAIMWEAWNGDNNKGDVWYVNTNNGELFRGWRAAKMVNIKGKPHTYEPNYFSKEVIMPTDKAQIVKSSPSFMIEPFFDDQKWEKAQESEVIALGAKKVTDILCLSFDVNSIPPCLNLNALKGNRPAIVAAMYSAATLIQRTFADVIDIQPEEIEISEVKIDPDNGLPSVYLNDSAPNGAGFISLLCKTDTSTGKTKLQEIMGDIVSPTPKSKFIQAILNHKNECKTSCPKCLNIFYNRGLHHVLDWRLGMDIIKLMLDKNYDMGYSDLANSTYYDLADVMNEVGSRVEKSNPAGNIKYYLNDSHGWRSGYFQTFNKGTTVIEHLVHPLWNVDDQNLKDGFKAQDLFTLQRGVKKSPQKADPAPTSTATPIMGTTDDGNLSQNTSTPPSGASGYGTLG